MSIYYNALFKTLFFLYSYVIILLHKYSRKILLYK